MHILHTPEADILVVHSILIKYVSEKSANEIITAMQAAKIIPQSEEEVAVYTPEADILVAHSILIRYLSEKSANEIITSMQRSNVLPIPDKEG